MMKKGLLVLIVVFICLAISTFAVDEACETNGDCGVCEKCVDSICVYQSGSEDLKDECSAGDCASGFCDGAGICDMQPDTVVCRASAGGCDVEEYCNGINVDCPADVFLPDTTECRAAAGDCDLAEYCSGLDADCPGDAYEEAGLDCGICAECDGSGNCVYDETQDNECQATICLDSCFLIPDDNSLTWDFASDVLNQCVGLFTCSNNPCSYTYECSISFCGAECEQDSNCGANTCLETYPDYCTDKKLTEYDDDKVMDSTIVNNQCENSCKIDCTCTDCFVECLTPAKNTYCVQGVCGADCDTNDDCAATDCDVLDMCYSGTYRDYQDVANTCLDNCDCTENECLVYTEIITDIDGDGYDIECDNDCDDSNEFTYQGAPEICDGLDNDCDGIVPSDEIDDDWDGIVECEGDCNDYDASVYPGALEVYCDGIDQNCNGMADDNPDLDGDGVNYCEDKCSDTKPWFAEIIRMVGRYDSSNLDPKTTYGCSCEQILYCKPGENLNELTFGCEKSTLDVWDGQYSWSLACQEGGKIKPINRTGETQWVINHGIGKDDLVDLYGHSYDLVYVDGRVNTYLTNKRGFQTQGDLYTLAYDNYGGRYWFSVDWNSMNNGYGAEFVVDNEDISVVNANARVVWNYQVSNNVPIEVTYHKTTRVIDVVGPEFSFVGIEPTEWCIRQGSHSLCRIIG